MPKVLHINCACTGSTGKIIGDIADYAVDKEYETFLCAPCVPGTNKNIRYFRTSLPFEQGIYRRLNRLYGFQYGFAPLSTLRIKRAIRKIRPDIIHLHCLNGYMVNVYSLARYIKKQAIPTVITNHAEFFYTGGCPHAYDCEKWLTGCGNCLQKEIATGGRYRDTSAIAWRRMKKAFAGFENAVMVSVSPWVGNRAKQSPITGELRQEVVLNGVNTDVFAYRDSAELREKYKISKNTKIIFHPTANFSASENDAKGGRYLIEIAKRFAGQDVLLVVAGRYASKLVAPENMHLLGLVSDQKILAEYYAMADVTVITGKRETFNMPVAESLCCGTPVVGFLAGGPESIAIEKYCTFVEYADVDALQEKINETLLQNFNRNEIAKQAKEKYASAVMAKGYLDFYGQLLWKEV